jgi:hypothetical protein
LPGVEVSALKLFSQQIRKSLAIVVVIVGLVTVVLWIPPSSPISDAASIGVVGFDPFRTNTEITAE